MSYTLALISPIKMFFPLDIISILHCDINVQTACTFTIKPGVISVKLFQMLSADKFSFLRGVFVQMAQYGTSLGGMVLKQYSVK